MRIIDYLRYNKQLVVQFQKIKKTTLPTFHLTDMCDHIMQVEGIGYPESQVRRHPNNTIMSLMYWQIEGLSVLLLPLTELKSLVKC